MIRLIRFFYYTLFALTPLVMSSATSEMFEFNKMIGIYAVAIITAGLYSAYYLINRPTIILPKLLYPFGIFLLALGISTYFSIDSHTSLYGYYGRWNGGLLSIIAYISLLFIFIQTFDKEHLRHLLLISLSSSALVILWAVPGWFGYDLSCLLFTGELTNTCWTAEFAPHVRMFSTLGQPNWLGSYLAVHLFIGLYFLHKSLQSTKLYRSLMSVYLILNLFAIYATKSKSSWYGVALALSIGLIVFFSFKIRKNIRSVVVIGSITSIILITVGILTFGSSLFTQKVPEHLEVTDSFTIRTYVWQGAVDLWKEYPVFGSGPETFAYAYYFTKPTSHNSTSEWDFVYNKAHNEFLNYLSTTGIIGFVSYMGIIAATLLLAAQVLKSSSSKLYITKRALPFALVLSYISILATNFFGFSTSNIQLFFYLIPGMIIVITKKSHSDPRGKGSINKFAVTVIALTTIMLLGHVFRMYYADILYTKAQAQVIEEDYQSGVQLLTQAMNFKYEHVYEDKLSSYLAHMAFISSFEEGATKEVIAIIDRSKLHNAQAIAHSPKNILYWRSKARNYYLYYQVSKDIQDLATAADAMKYTTHIAPNDSQGYYMSALFYSVLYSETEDEAYREEAVSYASHALTLRPQYVEASELLGGIEASPSFRE